MVELRHGPCPRCGCVDFREVDESHIECAECGLGATVGRITLTGRPDGLPPDPAHERFLEDQRAMARIAAAEVPFQPFALDDRWMGPRSLGGHGSGSNGSASLTLTHGDPLAPSGPLIRVESELPGRFPPAELARAFKAKSLVSELYHHTGALRDDVRRAAYPGDIVGDPTAPWEHTAMPIDGAEVATDVLAEGAWWVAVTIVDDLVVSVTARSWPYELTGLEREADLGAYDLTF